MSKKIAPCISDLMKHGSYAWKTLSEEGVAEVEREIRALLAVERSVRKEHRFCPTFEKCPACRALARLDRLSSGTGKRKGGSRG